MWRPRSRRTWRRWSAERAQLAGFDRAAVQRGGNERPGSSGLGKGAQVGDVAHPAAGQQLELGKAGAEAAHQREVGTGAGSHAREVEHDDLAYAGLRESCQRLGRSKPGQLGVRREDTARPEVEAEHERGVRELRPQPLEGALVRERLGADHDARRAQLEQLPDCGDFGGAGIDHHPRLLRQSGEDLAVPRSTGDRVEIGDVQLVEPERLADAASDPDRV
jgi:hypothetical protein